jgi:hypothetical protein
MNTLSRRAALAGATAVAGSVVNLTAITATRPCELPPDTGPDAELIRLGNELRQLWWDEKQWEQRIENLSDTFHAVVDRYARSAGVPDKREDWDHAAKHASLYVACLSQAGREHPDYYAACEQAEEHFLRISKVMEAIRDMPARTYAGLAVKALATEYANRDAKEDAKPFTELDWDREFMVDLIQSVQALAGGTMGRIRRKETREQDTVALREAMAARQGSL